MKLLDILFGRTRLKKPQTDALFGILGVEVDLQAKLSITPSGRAGLCLRPVASSFFQTLEQEVQELLKVSSRATGTEAQTTTDEYGFLWVVVEDPQFDDLVSTLHLVQETAQEHGYGEQLLAAVFGFQHQGQPLYWVYNYKRGKFYPFAPRPGQQRDSATEMRISSVVEKELPVDESLEQWYALWGVPV